LQTTDLAFYNAKNELVFERKKGQTKPKKGPKKRLLWGIEPEFAIREAAADGRIQGGLHELRI
jgi:hypothetical protein